MEYTEEELISAIFALRRVYAIDDDLMIKVRDLDPDYTFDLSRRLGVEECVIAYGILIAEQLAPKKSHKLT